jgi:hypothetical protein
VSDLAAFGAAEYSTHPVAARLLNNLIFRVRISPAIRIEQPFRVQRPAQQMAARISPSRDRYNAAS